MEESDLLLTYDVPTPPYDAIVLFKLQEYLRKKTCGFCYDVRPLSHAQILNVREMSSYVVHLWTLIENRWTSKSVAPYYGDEPLPNIPAGNIWQDYQFEPPGETILLNQGGLESVRDLNETQRKERCTKCDCLGHIDCPKCKRHGHLKCIECKQTGKSNVVQVKHVEIVLVKVHVYVKNVQVMDNMIVQNVVVMVRFNVLNIKVINLLLFGLDYT